MIRHSLHLAGACLLLAASAAAQTGATGIGTPTPTTTLDVAGSFTTREATPIVVSGPVAIPALTASQFRLTGSPGAPFTITGPTTGNGTAPLLAGARLVIVNATAFAGTLNGFPVQPGQALTFTYSNGAWYAANNGLSTNSPWYKVTTFTPSYSLTDNIYHRGTVAIGDSIQNNIALRVVANGVANAAYGVAASLEQGLVNNQDPISIGFRKLNGKTWAAGMGSINFNQRADSNSFSINEDHNADGFGIPRFTVAPGGLVGINQTNPQAPLQLSNTLANRKIVLFDNTVNAANDSAFYGFGINNLALRYQVPGNGNHVFYSNKSEIMRLVGPTGAMGIGTASPRANLHISNAADSTAAVDGSVTGKIGLGGDGRATPATYIQAVSRNGVNNEAELQFGTAAGGNSSTKMVLTAEGNLGLGTTVAPATKLEVNGTFVLGANGTALNGIIRGSGSSAATIATASGTTYTSAINVPGAVAGGIVSVSPAVNLPSGVLVAYARVSSANTVTIGLTNTSGAALNIAAVTFNIVVVQ